MFATRSHFDYHDPAAIAQLAGWLKETGLALHGIHAPIADRLLPGNHWGDAISNAVSDSGKRQAAVREADAALNIARQIPTEVFVVHLGTPTVQGGENNRTAAFRSVEEICRLAEPIGIRVALEVIPNPISDGTSLVDMLEKDLDAPRTGICLDFGHAFLMGDVADTIEAVAEHLITTHVHDNNGQEGRPPGPLRRAAQLGHRADDDAEGRLRRDLPDGARQHRLAGGGAGAGPRRARAIRQADGLLT